MGPSYRALRAQYVAELSAAVDAAHEWWNVLLDSEGLQSGELLSAQNRIEDRWPAGYAAHPRILAVVRKYYLACDDLNRRIGEQEDQDLEQLVPYSVDLGLEEPAADEDLIISPGVLIHESLFTPGTERLAGIVSQLTYWPIGVDEEGRYV
jgi:hypothetical protein